MAAFVCQFSTQAIVNITFGIRKCFAAASKLHRFHPILYRISYQYFNSFMQHILNEEKKGSGAAISRIGHFVVLEEARKKRRKKKDFLCFLTLNI